MDNLSLALRHILQQIVDSTNESGHKNTDMTLPHDGYKQRLSWYFECDRCQFKTFYAHDMENHKGLCRKASLNSGSKKRKLQRGPPKIVSSSTHPPTTTTDSDQDSQPSMSNIPPAVPSRLAGIPIDSRFKARPPKLQKPNIISMEPTDVDFQTGISSPDEPTIPEHNDNSRKTLDFESPVSPVNQVPSSNSVPASADMTGFDTDILEIKIEHDGDKDQDRSAADLPTDIVFPPNPHALPDAAMLDLFSQYNNPAAPIAQMTPPQQTGSPSQLSIGKIASLKKPTHSPGSASKLQKSTSQTLVSQQYNLDLTSDTDFITFYLPSIKRLFRLEDDNNQGISHSKCQQLKITPFETIESKRVYTAELSRNFLFRLARMGFGNVVQGKTKKTTFHKNTWAQFNSNCRAILNQLGISELLWREQTRANTNM